MKYASVAAVAAFGIILSGCASIVEGTTQSVAVTTPPADGAKCTLVSSEGTWYVMSPGNAQVHKTKNNLNVTCKKDGYQDASVVIEPHFNGATLGNVLAGGVIGIGIDAATGANFNYPETIAVPMTPIGASAAPVVPPTAATPPAAPVKPSS